MRLFFALQLPESVKEQLAPALERARQTGDEGVGVTPLEQLHFTLPFLGETDKLEDATAAAQSVGELPQFDLAISGRGAFPGLGRPRVLWLGVDDGKKQLCEVAETLCAALKERG